MEVISCWIHITVAEESEMKQVGVEVELLKDSPSAVVAEASGS